MVEKLRGELRVHLLSIGSHCGWLGLDQTSVVNATSQLLGLVYPLLDLISLTLSEQGRDLGGGQRTVVLLVPHLDDLLTILLLHSYRVLALPLLVLSGVRIEHLHIVVVCLKWLQSSGPNLFEPEVFHRENGVLPEPLLELRRLHMLHNNVLWLLLLYLLNHCGFRL